MAARVHRSFKVIEFNANCIWRQCCELRKLQGLRTDILLSETYLKHYERFCILSYHVYLIDHFPGRKVDVNFEWFSYSRKTIDYMETARRNVWRQGLQNIRTFVKMHCLFKSEHLSADIKLTLHKALIKSEIIYACSTWEFVTCTCLIKL
jgi:hypothetical protein